MRQLLALVILLATLPFSLSAQLVTTVPAAPTDDQAVTITFDATQGTGGLADCNCDVYVHTGVITNVSNEWRYVQTEWGVDSVAWKMTPVDGEPNKYTYTYSPTVREYYGVPDSETIQKISLVFRDAEGNIEGKASGNQDIFIDISEGGDVLGITTIGDPDQDFWPLGKPLPVQLGATVSGTLEVFDNGDLVATATGVELVTDVIFTTPGEHTVRFVATSTDGQTKASEFTINARLEVSYTDPTDNIINTTAGSQLTLSGTSFIESNLTLSDGTNTLFTGTASDFSELVTVPDEAVSTITITSTYQGETAVDRITFVTGGPETAEAPDGIHTGINEMEDGNVILQLRAPGKSDVFVIHNFNGFTPTATSRMKRTGDGTTFWVELDNLPDTGDLLYQYLIDGNIVQPDAYSALVLDPFNDGFIQPETFAGIPPYPQNLANGIITWHRRQRPEYIWQSAEDYERPDPKRMVVYELLVRDFVADHSFKTVLDTLDYLERLGINTIELMPVNEFEGNESWGYNPSFHMALDKYYGSPEDLKALVDACHERGIAVVLDIVYNHAFGQSPLARMWWDEDEFRPTSDNPYLNVEATHPFNVGYDFNHESELTKEYVKTTTRYWLEEFRIDGFRWDLSKGFTQRDANGDVGAWGRYDASRIAILKEYADHVWSIDEETYMIMEHLAEQREEEELAQYGNDMYFWSGFNPHDNYLQAAMGYDQNGLGGALSQNRGFSDRNLVAYMESHDEERMQFKNMSFGNGMGDYQVKDKATGLDRVELASTFFYTLPGPKMLWQFGELGYDFNINYCPDGTTQEGCRVANKPIRWDYREDPDRQDIYNWIADLNFLRNNYDLFHGEVTKQDLGGLVKIANLDSDDGQVAIVGNFDVQEVTTTGVFPAAGTWYNYATDQTEEITDPNQSITLQPGEYRLYLSQVIRAGGGSIGTSTNAAAVNRLQLQVNPNPTDGLMVVDFTLPTSSALSADLLDLNGRLISRLHQGRASVGNNRLTLDAAYVPAGMYLLRITDGVGSAVKKVVIR